MRLAVLIGASRRIDCSPIVPLPEGRFRFDVFNLNNTEFTVNEDGPKVENNLVIDGGRSIQLIKVKDGSEDKLINISLVKVV